MHMREKFHDSTAHTCTARRPSSSSLPCTSTTSPIIHSSKCEPPSPSLPSRLRFMLAHTHTHCCFSQMNPSLSKFLQCKVFSSISVCPGVYSMQTHKNLFAIFTHFCCVYLKKFINTDLSSLFAHRNCFLIMETSRE